jgi:N-hydroxyarylamine O-acetyltransferase
MIILSNGSTITLTETHIYSPEQIEAYLKRIEYGGSLNVSLETLRGLHSAHVFHIPFENLNIHLGKPISLEPHAIFDKIVNQRRGGYCYEMNGLFSSMLIALGFDVTRLQGRIMFGVTEVRPRSHQISLVKIDGQEWIADVGYGGRGLLEPIQLIPGVEVRQYTESFRLREAPFYGYILQSVIEGEWQNLVGFTLEPQHPVDYRFPNYWNSTSPDSNFVKHRTVALATPEGRKILTDMQLKIRRHADVTTETLPDMDAYRQALADHFGLIIEDDFLPLPV